MDQGQFLRAMAEIGHGRLHALATATDPRGARELAEAIRDDVETVLMVLDRGGA